MIRAAVHGQRDIAVGNVVGSHLCDLLAVPGTASAVAPGGLPIDPAMLSFDLPVMLAVTLACPPIFFAGHRVARWEGRLFLAYDVAHTAYVLMAAMAHDRLPMFNSVLPLSVVTLAVGVSLCVLGLVRQNRLRSGRDTFLLRQLFSPHGWLVASGVRMAPGGRPAQCC